MKSGAIFMAICLALIGSALAISDSRYRIATISAKNSVLGDGWDFQCNQPGLMIDPRFDGIFIQNTDLSFGNGYFSDKTIFGFKCGVQGREKCKIIDLGTPAQLADKYKVKNPIGGSDGMNQFITIDIKDPKDESVTIASERKSSDIVGRVKMVDVNKAFEDANTPDTIEHPEVNHIYMMKVTDEGDTKIIVKFYVEAIVPEQSVTLFYRILKNERRHDYRCNTNPTQPGYINSPEPRDKWAVPMTAIYVVTIPWLALLSIYAGVQTIVSCVNICLAVGNKKSNYQIVQ